MPSQRRETDRFYVPTGAMGTLDGSRIGISWLTRHASEWSGDPLMVIPSEAHLERNHHIEAATRRFPWVTSIAFRSAQSQGWDGGPTLLLYPPETSVLAWFDRSRLVPALGVVQGTLFDTTAWARARQTVDLTNGRVYPFGPSVDPVVHEALLALREQTGGRGLTTKRDVATMERTFRLLQADGQRLTPADIEAWALMNRWSLAAAHRLALGAGRVTAGEGVALAVGSRPSTRDVRHWHDRAAAR